MIKEVLDSIQQRIVDAFEGFAELAYIGGWYTIVVVIILICMVIRFFFPFKWISASLGFIVLMSGAFMAGMQVMFNHAKKDNQGYRDKIKELHEEHKQNQGGGGWFS